MPGPAHAAGMPAVVAAGTTPVLSARNVTKAYANGARVLAGVDLEIGAGEAIALIGANGAGKSTLIRCLLRLTEPSGGDIRLFGSDMRTLHGARLRRLRARVGFVFQRHNLVQRLSALSNVVHGAQARASGPGHWHQVLAPRRVRDEALACLDRVGLADKAGTRADALSGGQSQRVAIARMLMQRPEFVIADEPDASLDPAAAEEVMRLLVETTRERGLGLLFISHDLDVAVRYSDRVVGLAGGRVTLDLGAAQADAAQLRGFFAPARAA